MKMLRRGARPRCPTKRHDAKWPSTPPDRHFSAPVVPASAGCNHFSAQGRNLARDPNLSLMWTTCPEFPVRRCDISRQGRADSADHEIAVSEFAAPTKKPRTMPGLELQESQGE